jgi:hypothetical protein
MDRVLATPLPIAYSIAISQITWVYVMLLPFQLWDDLRWITIPGCIFAAYIIIGLASIGREIENPFGHDVNDLPLEAIAARAYHGRVHEPHRQHAHLAAQPEELCQLGGQEQAGHPRCVDDEDKGGYDGAQEFCGGQAERGGREAHGHSAAAAGCVEKWARTFRLYACGLAPVGDWSYLSSPFVGDTHSEVLDH